jgi:hypothetical protein
MFWRAREGGQIFEWFVNIAQNTKSIYMLNFKMVYLANYK